MTGFSMDQLPQADRDQLRETLLQIRTGTGKVPLIPLDVDLDGDGIVDSFGLDENDEVVLVSGVKLEETVYRSEGDDVALEVLDG